MDSDIFSKLYDFFAWPHVLMTASKTKKELGDLRGDVLEVGSGTGLLTAQLAWMPELRITGVEPSPYMMKRAQERKTRLGLENVVFVPGRAEALPVESGKFEAVVMSYSLRHVNALDDAAGELARVVRPGGKLLIADVYFPLSGGLPGGVLRQVLPGVAVLHPPALAEYLESRGFDTRSLSYYPLSFLLTMQRT